MDVELYERINNIKWGIILLFVGVLLLLVCIWDLYQRLQTLDVYIGTLRERIIAVETKGEEP